jgi:frataxin-like iron-binding protein CyaY
MDGVINIFLPNEKQYVINKHFPSLQIWLSSPISGANYFNWDNDKKIWKDKLEHELKTIIYDEIQRNYGPKST